MPFSAPLPVPTIIAVGVARPKAQGQAIISTAIKTVKAKISDGSGPKVHQSRALRVAISTTAGTNQAAIWSTKRWTGALEPWASSTRRIIRASIVSLPTLVARIQKLPLLLRVAPISGSETSLLTGKLSPVSIDSSTLERPAINSPSTGIFSPGRTRMISPTWTSSIGMSIGTPLGMPPAAPPGMPSRITRAVLALRPISLRMASEVLPRARASSRRPSRIRVVITVATS